MIPRRSLLTTVWKGTRSVFIAGSNNNALPPYPLEDVSAVDISQAPDLSHATTLDKDARPAAASLPAVPFPNPKSSESQRPPTRAGFDTDAPIAKPVAPSHSSGASQGPASAAPVIAATISSGNQQSSSHRQHASAEDTRSVGKEREAFAAREQGPVQEGLCVEAGVSGRGSASMYNGGSGGGVVQGQMPRSVLGEGVSMPLSGLTSAHAASEGVGEGGRREVHNRAMSHGAVAGRPFHSLPRQSSGFMDMSVVSGRTGLEAARAEQVAMQGVSPFPHRPHIIPPDIRGLQLLSMEDSHCRVPAGAPPLLHPSRPPIPMVPFMHMPVFQPPPHVASGQPTNQNAPFGPLWTPAPPAGAPASWADATHGPHPEAPQDARWPLPGTGLICYMPQPGFEAHAPPTHVNNIGNRFANGAMAAPQYVTPAFGAAPGGASVGSWGPGGGAVNHHGLGNVMPSPRGVQIRGPVFAVEEDGRDEREREQKSGGAKSEAVHERLEPHRTMPIPTTTSGWSFYPKTTRVRSKDMRPKDLRKEMDHNTKMAAALVEKLTAAAKTEELTVERIAQLFPGRRFIRSFEICQVLKTANDLSIALPLFEWCKQQRWYRPDVYVYTTMIGLAGEFRDGALMQTLYDEMMSLGIHPTHVTFNRLIFGYGRSGLTDKAGQAFEELDTECGGADAITYHTMIDLYSKAGQIEKAEGMFRRMQDAGIPATVVAYGQLMWMYGSAEEVGKAERCFRRMRDSGLAPNEVIYNIMINLYGRVGRTDQVIAMVDDMMSAGLNPDILTYTTLINQFGKQGRVADAEHVFNLMMSRRSGEDADNVAFTTMIDVFAKMGETENALKCFQKMLDLGVRPHNVTYNVLLNLFIRRRDFTAMRQVFDTMVKLRLTPCLPTYTMLLSVCTPDATCEGNETVMSLLPSAHPAAFSLLQALLSPAPSPSTAAPIPSLPLSPLGRAHMSARGLNPFALSFTSRAISSARTHSPSTPTPNGPTSRHISTLLANVVEKQNMEHLRGYFDAMVNFLSLCGRPSLADAIWAEAETRRVYPFFLDVRPNTWRVDLHCMSSQTAAVALVSALRGFQRKLVDGETAPGKVVVVTGWGKRSRVQGASSVKQTVQDLLTMLRSPFSVDVENNGILVGDGKVVHKWLLKPEMNELLTLKDPK